MNELPMPSDVKREAKPAMGAPSDAPADQPLVEPPGVTLIEPPSAKLIVRLFLIPFIIVALAVGVMFLIGRLAGSGPSFEQALSRLRNPGGERTVDMLVGPGSKQRYMDAKTVADKIMKVGADPVERVKISDQIIDVLDNHSNEQEGEVRHFLLLALGRAWQLDQPRAREDSEDTPEARRRAFASLMKYADSGSVSTKKAAILALAYWAKRDEVKGAIPMLTWKVRDESQDLDVRLSAATVLGVVASPNDADVIDALKFAMRDTNPANLELVWGSALSLAQLGQKDVAETILLLLDRKELSAVKILDRETDSKNPTYRPLSDQEQQRILINTMIGAVKLDVPAVQERLRWLQQNDPSPRVKAAAQEVLAERETKNEK